LCSCWLEENQQTGQEMTWFSEELASANIWRKIISWGTVIKQHMILYIDK
jgi:hypothetical protein